MQKKMRGLCSARVSAYSHREPTVIFDFDNDWHCALMLKRGMSKATVAQKLHDMAELILNQERIECDTGK